MVAESRYRDIQVTPAMEKRFWDKVALGDGCWEWVASKTSLGYGHFSIGYRYFLAHRVAYGIVNGKIPDLDMHHTCGNPGCVRPAHLMPLSRSDHSRQSGHVATLGRNAAACRRGHPFTPENTGWNAKYGWRYCRTCDRAARRRRRNKGRS